MCSKKPIKALGGGISNPTQCTLEQLTARKKDSEDKTKIKQTRKQNPRNYDFFIQANCIEQQYGTISVTKQPD